MILQKARRFTKALILRAICVLTLAGILVAGLWPFHSPANQVSWLKNENGLQFGKYGTVLSKGELKSPAAPAEKTCSLEIWVEPDYDYAGGTLLAFYLPGSPHQFSLHQSKSDLEVLSNDPDQGDRASAGRFYLGGLFGRRRAVFITVTSDGVRTAVYIDGVLTESAYNFP